MRFNRKVFSAALLGVFLLLVIPKSWLHNCEHDYSHFHYSKGISKAEKPCAACDLQISPFAESNVQRFNFEASVFYTHYFFHEAVFQQIDVNNPLLRGPPTV